MPFKPLTERIKTLAKIEPDKIDELKHVFNKTTNIYIDFANVFRWQEKLGWHIDLRRLKQLLNSFRCVNKIYFYSGTAVGNCESERFIKDVEDMGYLVKTKPVKIMRIPIDVSSVPSTSTEIIESFIRKPLLQKFSVETVEYLNQKLKELNKQGIMFIEDLKCNFDVEIGRDMLLDYAQKSAENFALWSGDSDFADPIAQLLNDGKKVVLFATVRKVASELNELGGRGLFIYDIQKIREFICWPREMKVRV